MRRLLAISVWALLAFAGTRAAAQNVGSYGMAPKPGEFDPNTRGPLTVRQNLNEMVPLDETFHDHDNRPVTLREIMAGKPTILVPAYYRCPKMCNEVLNGLLKVLRELQAEDPEFAAGRAFNVVTFSVDAREPYALARKKREEYLKQYDGRDPNQPGWWFLTASAGQFSDVGESQQKIRRVTNALGYPFIVADRKVEKNGDGVECVENDWGELVPLGNTPRPQGSKERDIQHSAAILIITPEGRIARYLSGDYYDRTAMRLSLIEASKGTISPNNKDFFAQLCMAYDQKSGHYKPKMQLLGIVAAPFVLLIFGIAYFTLRKARRETKLTLPAEPPIDSNRTDHPQGFA